MRAERHSRDAGPGASTGHRTGGQAGRGRGLALGAGALLLLCAQGCAASGVRESTAATAADAPVGAVDRTIASLPGVEDALADPPVVSDDSLSDVRVEAVPIDASDLVRGRATVSVHAPIAAVRKAVLDFKHYPEFMPHYEGAKVLGRTADGARDVYMEVSALHGAVKMWTRIEMPKPVMDGDVETHESRFVDGNVKEFKAIWRLKPVSAEETELSLELYVRPGIPIPSSLLNDENVKNAGRAVDAMRGHIEGRSPRND
jgi:ribosome-associated toxin RatA of RatAB toxin-antitoxin module